jgi:hypothetical protein
MKQVFPFLPKLSISNCNGIIANVDLEKKLEILEESIGIGCNSYTFDITINPHVDKFSPCPSTIVITNCILMETEDSCILMENGVDVILFEDGLTP